jgi:hypothetical protein
VTRKIKGELGGVEVFQYWWKTPIGFIVTGLFGIVSLVTVIGVVINITSL